MQINSSREVLDSVGGYCQVSQNGRREPNSTTRETVQVKEQCLFQAEVKPGSQSVSQTNPVGAGKQEGPKSHLHLHL